MAIDLTKVIYKQLEEGSYGIKVKSWDVKQTKDGDDYIVLASTIPELNDRPVQINLFERGLNIIASNVATHLDLGEISLVDILNEMIGKDLPAYHQIVKQNGQTYYNWFICSKPRISGDEQADDEVAF